MTMSMYSSEKNLAAKLMITRSIVGTKTVNKLLMIGLSKVPSTTMTFILLMVDLHI